LPTGGLRDQKASYKRANVIVVTKCPPGISLEETEKIKEEIAPTPKQQVFFSTIQYADLYHIVTKEIKRLSLEDEVLLVCGIANPTPLKNYLVQQSGTYYQLSFSDHHIFTIDDLNEVKEKFEEITAARKIIITTEKDAVRLMKFKNELMEIPIYVLPIQHRFLFGRGTQFDDIVNTFIKTFQDNNIYEQKR
jgi:tetraacyldisaccharide 4'-kinase